MKCRFCDSNKALPSRTLGVVCQRCWEQRGGLERAVARWRQEAWIRRGPEEIANLRALAHGENAKARREEP